MGSLHCVAKLYCITDVTDVGSLHCVAKLHCITDVTDVGVSYCVAKLHCITDVTDVGSLTVWLLCDDQLFAEVKFLLFVLSFVVSFSFVIELGTEPRVSDVQGKHSATEL